ncbi:MAG: 4Fe-4S cluster-binding domain-containing protein [Paludibacteraceae bacterium]|nr:4Fe-4S cluster-binding domain-containing protein [Paludibacteraceae bacterium]
MLKVASYDIVFQEIPGEVTLALNLSGCPCHCPGCHSPHLAEDIGEELNEELLDGLLDRYGSMITCVCFMGGDQAPKEVAQLAAHVKGIKTAWYSGRMNMPEGGFDYVKLGGYVESLGGLKSPTTNQRLYKRVENEWQDITSLFWQKRFE